VWEKLRSAVAPCCLSLEEFPAWLTGSFTPPLTSPSWQLQSGKAGVELSFYKYAEQTSQEARSSEPGHLTPSQPNWKAAGLLWCQA
jgi:hypothetical protein